MEKGLTGTAAVDRTVVIDGKAGMKDAMAMTKEVEAITETHEARAQTEAILVATIHVAIEVIEVIVVIAMTVTETADQASLISGAGEKTTWSENVCFN